MSDADRLTPADPEDIADALAFALRYSGRKRTHDAGEVMAAIVGQAPGGAPRTLRLRRHEKTADRRRRRDWARGGRAMIRAWFRRDREAERLAVADTGELIRGLCRRDGLARG